MTTTNADQDFGYQDFALVQAPLDVVLEAVNKSISEQTSLDAGIVAEPMKSGTLVGLLLKMTPFGKAMDRAAKMEAEMSVSDAPLPAYTACRGELTLAPRLMTSPYTPGFGPQAQSVDVQMKDDMRLRQLVGAPWVLVEYYEYASGMSMMGMDLSLSIPQTDVLYFRRSGGQAKEPHYDFHVYRDGTPERRVLCHCTHPDGDPQQAWWEGISDDAQTGYEPDDLYDGATQETLLDNAGIDRILQQMGLSIAALFAPTDNMILFSRA